jgi:hypothetical protein
MATLQSSASYLRDDDIALYEIAALLGSRVVIEVVYGLLTLSLGRSQRATRLFFDLSGLCAAEHRETAKWSRDCLIDRQKHRCSDAVCRSSTRRRP